MAYTNAQLTTKLSVKLRDTADSKWTSSEKDECLDEAYEDPAVSYIDVDASLTASLSTQSYDIPATVDKIVDVAIADSSGVEYRVNPALWEQKYGHLVFRQKPPMAGTLTLTVIKKYATTDSLPTEFANFVLALACQNAFEMLMTKYTSGFLTNDVSAAEIQVGLAYWERKARQERAKLGRVTNRQGYRV